MFLDAWWATFTPREQIFWWGNICIVIGFVIAKLPDIWTWLNGSTDEE